MHPDLVTLLQTLPILREDAGLTKELVEEKLVIGEGWIDLYEAGDLEPSLGVLAALLDLYDVSLAEFFSEIDLASDGVIVDRHLTASAEGNDIFLHFPMGSHLATVKLENTSIEDFNEILLTMRNKLSQDDKRGSIVDSFLKAVHLWPHANPSDLWYFLISHAYQDDFNHPASSAGKDWPQSWKRAGGWSLEAIFVSHYNPFLATKGISLEMPEPNLKREILESMGLNDPADVEKADVLAMGTTSDGEKVPFGVIHVKASLAERRTDDAPLSARLISANYASPLLTMDCKASPRDFPVNKGELGAVQGGGVRVSSKRLDIEERRVFDAAFSYNTNTLPTPAGTNASARIVLCDFSNPDDKFSEYLERKWKDRQGI